jgi:hypothetical protein
MWSTWKMKESRMRESDNHHNTEAGNELTETSESRQQSWRSVSLLIDTVQNKYKFVDAFEETF